MMSETKDLDCYTPIVAKTKICPVGAGTENCGADSCMAWRWSQANQTAAYSRAVLKHAVAAREVNPKHKLDQSYRDVLLEQGEALTRTEGYCGLAGYPHNSLRP